MEKGHKMHGGKGTKLYEVWCSMRQRCYNTNNKSYKNYGGRGISICEEWSDFANFRDWAMNNGYREGLSIERLDVNSNYEPQNCCWISIGDQSKNKSNTIKVLYNGKEVALHQLAEEYKINYDVLYYRVVIGKMLIEDALSKSIENMPLKVGQSGERYIYKRKDGYQVIIHKKYYGFATTFEKAKELRDLKLKELEGKK